MKNQDDFTQFFTPKSAGGTAEFKEAQPFSVKSIDEEKRQITGVASAEVIDRDNEIVTIAALRKAIKGYMQNPVILAGHMHRTDSGKSPVIGKVISYEFKGKQLYITVQFANTPLAEEYWQLYRDKFQRAFSIGFRVLKYHEDHQEGTRIWVIDELELFEISCVAVPANRAALSKAKTFGQRKQITREKQRIWDDDEAVIKLLDRFGEIDHKYRDVFGNIPEDSKLWEKFSAAEAEILKDFENEEDFSIVEGCCDDTDDELDVETEDYVKSLRGGSGPSDGDLNFFDDFGPDDSEPDYF